MKKQDQLFYLVKSLKKEEIANFRKSVTGNKNYLDLFNAILEQEKYNEKEIKELFRNRKLVKQLHVTKNYLIKKILKSIARDNSEISINIKLNNILSEIELLYNRDLIDQCQFQIEKALKLASLYEKESYSAIILDWKSKLNIHKKRAPGTNEIARKSLEQQKVKLQNALLETDYWLLTLDQIKYFGKPEEVSQLFYNSPLIKDAEKAKTLRAKINYYHINYSKSLTSNSPEGALDYLDKLISLLESNPHRIIEDPSSYITSLNNKVSILLSLKKYESMPYYLELIRSIPEKYKLPSKDKVSVRLNLRTYNIELEMYRDTKEYSKAELLITEIESFIDQNYQSITKNYIVLFYYQFAYIYFMLKNYDKALSWTNQILHKDFELIRSDLYTYARFLNLMIHFELDNRIVLKYAVDGTRKYLKKRRALIHFEKVLLRFFSRISQEKVENRKKLFLKLEEEIFSKTDENKRNEILDYIDFENWIAEKVSNH